MKRFKKLFKLNLISSFLWFFVFYALGVFALYGKPIILTLYTIFGVILLALSRVFNEKSFAWHLERVNPNLKERLISLVELKGVKHPAVFRLEEEVNRERLVFVPFITLPMYIFSILSVLVFLSSFVKLPEKPLLKFYADRSLIFEGETLHVKTQPRVDEIHIKGYGEIKGNGEFKIYGLKPGNYRIYAKGYKGEFSFTVISRPVLYGVKGFIVPPKYTGLPERPIGITNVAYEGSRFRGLKIEHNGDSAEFEGLPEVITKDTTVYVRVFKGGKGFIYKAFSVEVVRDNPPSVSINPSGTQRVEGGKANVVISAYDDIALRDVGLIINGKRDRLELQGRIPNALFELEFDVSDTLKIVAYAEDVAGKVSLSDTLILLPKDAFEDFKEKLLSLDKIGSLESRLKEIEERLKADDRLSYSTKQEIAAATKSLGETYKEMQEALERFAKELNDPEISNLINEIRKTFKEVMDEELRKSLEELNRALEKADPKEVAQALKNLRLSQRELKEQLERFAKLLNRYKQEKDLKELSERLSRLSQMQQDITGKRDSLTQREITSEIDSIRQRLEDYKNVEGVDNKKLEELLRKLDESSKLSQEALNKMQKGGDFKREQAKTSLKLSEASNLADDLYNSLVQNRTNEIVSQLNDISDISAFMNQRLSENPDEKTLENAKFVMKDVEDKLRELSEKSVFVSPKLKDLAKQIYEDINKAHNEMARGNTKGVQEGLESAREGLIQLSIMTSASAQACQNSGGSTGMSQYLRQLSRMAGEQGSISQNIMPSLSPEELAELAARQMALNQALRGLIDNMRREGMPGDVLRQLEETLRQMEELERDLKDAESLNRLYELRKKAERIEIRLLEAKEALRKQRTEPVYEAERPKPYKIKTAEYKRVIDKRVIAEIYKKVLTNRRLSPQESEIYEKYIKNFLE
ncbi:MAG: hypothetical protein ABIL88_07950 [candidate division WOR-3 bacterium]